MHFRRVLYELLSKEDGSLKSLLAKKTNFFALGEASSVNCLSLLCADAAHALVTLCNKFEEFFTVKQGVSPSSSSLLEVLRRACALS